MPLPAESSKPGTHVGEILTLHLEGAERLLEGKVAVVTGGAQSIGKAISEALLRNGARVAIFDSNKNQLKETVSDLTASGPVRGCTVDVRRKAQIVKSVEKVENQVGPIGILVNCAGVIAAHDFQIFPESDIDRILDVNLRGALLCTQVIGARMAKGGIAGSIISISSNHARLGFPRAFPYDASKGGLEAATRSFAAEMGQYGIRVNCIEPGAIYPTGMTPAVTDEMIQAIPLGRAFHPNEVANIVVFLASDLASAVTGSVITADGGQSASATFAQK